MKKIAIQIEIRDGRSQRRQVTEVACSVQIRYAALRCLMLLVPNLNPRPRNFPPDFSLFLSIDREDSKISSARVLRYAIFGSLDGFAGRDCLGW